MSMRTARSLLLPTGIIILIAGCSRPPTDPCTQPGVCTLPQPDLSVAAAVITAHERDAQSGLPVVDPAAIPLRVVVRNDGSGAAPATTASVTLQGRTIATSPVPSLTAGTSHTLDIVADAQLGAFLFDTDIRSLEVHVAAVEDDVSNNSRGTGGFHAALPVLRVRTELDGPGFRADHGTAAAVTVENISRHATLASSSITLCLHVPGAACHDAANRLELGRLHTGTLPPGASTRLATTAVVPSAAVHQNLVEAWQLSTCVGEDLRACGSALQVEVRPDYEACAPPLLEPDAPVSTQPVCTRPCPIRAYAVSVRPGRTYLVETPAGAEDTSLRWRTRFRGDVLDTSSAPGLQPATAATVYAVTALRFCEVAGVEREVVLRERDG
ncbi:MAG TPA: CARDB domain-containing protein [Longimicrobiales bacterium]|nr:CARDB domain-containing protein [Longimicrobiales bacterium]